MTEASMPEGRKFTARAAAFVLGVIMTLLPWYVGGPSAAQHHVSFWNCLVTGILMMGVAATAIVWRRAYWPAWVFLVLVAWTILSPDTLSFEVPEMSVAHLILGGLGIPVAIVWIQRALGRRPVDRQVVRGRTFRDCSSSERILYGSILVVIGLGYCMALAYLYMTHQGLSGKPGMSVQDVSISYYGNRSGTRLEAMLRGPMAGYAKQQDRDQIFAWLKSGAGEAGYNTVVHPIVERDCAGCHSAKSGMNLPDFTTFAGIKAVSKVDTGMSLQTLVKLSHIHLFGIGLLAFVLGYVFTFVSLPIWLKNLVIVTPFFAIVLDIATWYLTKWDPIYAYTVIVAGAALGVAWGIQILLSLYQIVFPAGNPTLQKPI